MPHTNYFDEVHNYAYKTGSSFIVYLCIDMCHLGRRRISITPTITHDIKHGFIIVNHMLTKYTTYVKGEYKICFIMLVQVR